MTTVSKPQGRISVGWATINGQRVPIAIDIEWDRFLDALVRQTNSLNASALVGGQGIPGATSMGMEGDAEGDMQFIPGPTGPQGPKGDPGPVIFLAEDPIDNDIYWRIP